MITLQTSVYFTRPHSVRLSPGHASAIQPLYLSVKLSRHEHLMTVVRIVLKSFVESRPDRPQALVVVYDFYPNSQTLYDMYLKPKQPVFHPGRQPNQHERLGEQTLMSYIFQIASAIKAVHDAGMAVRTIDASKVLVTGQNRCVQF